MTTNRCLRKACDGSATRVCASSGTGLGDVCASSGTGLGDPSAACVHVTVRNIQRTVSVPEAWLFLIRKTVAQCLLISPFPHPASVSIVLAGNRTVANLNRQFRNRRGVTDVLSFPALHYRAGSPILSAGDIDPETGEVFLGDIVICLPRMREQATGYGHGEDRELGFLAAHGMLHLLGHDHETPDEDQRMSRMQETALSAIGLSRPGGDR